MPDRLKLMLYRDVCTQKLASICDEARLGTVRHGWTVIDEGSAITVRDGHISCVSMRSATAIRRWGTHDDDSAPRGVLRCPDV